MQIVKKKAGEQAEQSVRHSPVEIINQTAGNLRLESEMEVNLIDGPSQSSQFPTKFEILEMFKKLENTIKKQKSIVQENFSHMLI